MIAVGGPGDWDSGSVYGHPNLVRLPGGELALPYSGTNRTHEEGWFDWNAATADLSAIRGRNIRLRFCLSCATVFGYRLAAAQK